MHHLFIVDFKKVYDSVWREVLYNLIEFGISMKLVRLIKLCLNETCSRVGGGKHLFDMFSIKNGLKQVLLLLLVNFALGSAFRRDQVKQDALKSNGTHQLSV